VAASLAWAYVRRKDRVGLIAYGGAFRWLKPGVGRAHFQTLLDQLLEANVVFSYVTRDLALVPRRVLPPQALVIAISPLVDERFVYAVQDLRARAFTVLLRTVSPAVVTRAVVRSSAATDLACRLWHWSGQRSSRRYGNRASQSWSGIPRCRSNWCSPR